MSEFVDLYDRNRKFLNRVVDRNTYLFQPGEFMMYVLAILENEEGKFLVTQRALDKKWAAGGWEMPGGGAKSKESSLDAIKREVKEETGLDVINGRAVAQVRSQHVNDGALRRQLHMIKLYAGKTYRIGTERASRSEDAAPLDTAQARRTHGRCPLGRSTALILSR